MRSITRQSSRLATSRAHITSTFRHRPRSTTKCLQRTFSSTGRLQFWSRPPPDPQRPGIPKELKGWIGQQEELSAKFENGDTESNAFANDKQRRNTRQRRADAAKQIPNPPPVPAWFLANNVWASWTEAHDIFATQSVKGPMWDANVPTTECVSGETGESLFTLPWADPKTLLFEESNAGEPALSDAKEKANPVSPKDSERAGSDKFSAVPGPFLESLFSIEAAMASSQEDPDVRSTSALSKLDLSLVCPDSDCHANMDGYVRRLAEGTGATIVALDANDLEELAGGFVGLDGDSPGSYSNFGYDVYAGYAATAQEDQKEISTPPDTSDDANDEVDMDIASAPAGVIVGPLGNGIDLGQVLNKIPIQIPAQLMGGTHNGRPSKPRRVVSSAWPDRSNSTSHVEDAKIEVLLNQLIDAPHSMERTRPFGSKSALMAEFHSSAEIHDPAVFKALAPVFGEGYPRGELDPFLGNSISGTWVSEFYEAIGGWLLGSIGQELQCKQAETRESVDDHPFKKQKTIVHVRDLHDLLRTRIGEQFVRRLLDVVQKRREDGQRIMVVGTTAQSGFGNWAYEHDLLETGFRAIKIPGLKGSLAWDDKGRVQYDSKNLLDASFPRILEINLRHIQSMLRRLRPTNQVDLFKESAITQMSQPNTSGLSKYVLPMHEVQRLVQVALGLSRSIFYSDVIHPVHLGLATQILAWSDGSSQVWADEQRSDSKSRKTRNGARKDKDGEQTSRTRVDQVRDSCNKREKRLLTGVVDARNIKTEFSDVHVAPDTIQALKMLTTLSLLRPEAFKYGVLANDRLPGLLLYGPPGTGKTMLAKAVAKESRATVLEISGAQIYEKYVGEGEKMVRAVFSLAKKLSPCVVFMDEADAIFSSRGNGGRNTHREIINQFLREWDGMDDHGVFIMVASNRPFDLDDAVLRRLPRRILVDLPEIKDRESILGIHLKDEALDPAVSLPQLAEQTPFYSGSDLKNLCVAAALACVREENDLLSTKSSSDPDFKLPEKRTLHPRHFDTAMAEISASISEDMGSLSAIRKFDEKFGDRKGRRKKSSLGFGNVGEEKVDESAVRVRRGWGIGEGGGLPTTTVESPTTAKGR